MRTFVPLSILLLAVSVHSQTLLTPHTASYSAILTGPVFSPGLMAGYSNTDALQLRYVPGAGVPLRDDIRLSWSGNVTGFEFAYYDSGFSYELNAVVRFYGDLGSGRSLLAEFGFYGLQAFSSAAFIAGADLRGTGYEFMAPQDLEMEISFSSPTAGWLLASGPDVGSSRDLFFIGSEPYFFGGNPEANFYANVFVAPEPGVVLLFASVLIAGFRSRKRK